jgi:hypothetical protein
MERRDRVRCSGGVREKNLCKVLASTLCTVTLAGVAVVAWIHGFIVIKHTTALKEPAVGAFFVCSVEFILAFIHKDTCCFFNCEEFSRSIECLP